MPVTVGRLLGQSDLRLTPRTGRMGLDRPVRWAAVSELLDPAPFLEGGELLLSTGLQLPHDDAPALRSYVESLVSVGVAAYGLGVGLTHDHAPDALVEAATGHGLPVLEVPRDIPFIAITKTLADLLAAELREEHSQVLLLQRRLVDAAMADEPTTAVLAVLAGALDGWALLLGPRLDTLASAGPVTTQQVATATADAARLAAHGLHSSASAEVAGELLIVQPVSAGGRLRGFLAVGTHKPATSPRRSLVAGAVSVLSLDPESGRRNAAALAHTRAAVLRLLVAGQPADATAVARAGGVALPGSPLRVLVADVSAEAAGRLVECLEEVGPAVLAARLDGGVVAVLPDSDAGVAAVTAAVDAVPAAAAGLSPSTDPDALPAAAAARQALGAARRGRRRVVDASNLGVVELLGLLHPAALRRHAEAVLAPLSAYGRNRDELLESLRAWLQHGGHWDEAAASVGLHRNTLRYRIRRVEELTGRDLSAMQDRVELWLALQALGQHDPAAPGG